MDYLHYPFPLFRFAGFFTHIDRLDKKAITEYINIEWRSNSSKAIAVPEYLAISYIENILRPSL